MIKRRRKRRRRRRRKEEEEERQEEEEEKKKKKKEKKEKCSCQIYLLNPLFQMRITESHESLSLMPWHAWHETDGGELKRLR